MHKLFGLITMALTISTPVLAFGVDDAPPFKTIACTVEGERIRIWIDDYRRTNGAGPATISVDGQVLNGVWNWKKAPEGTRLDGYHLLTVGGPLQDGQNVFYYRDVYSPNGKLSGGWIETQEVSGLGNCEIVN